MRTEKINMRDVLYYIPLPVIAAAFLLLQMGRMEPIYILRFEALIVFGYVISIGDLKAKRIPNTTVLLMLAAWVMITVPQIFTDVEAGLDLLVTSALGAGAAMAVFLTVYFLSKQGLGGGDVKFMTVAGLYLGVGGVMPSMLIGTLLAAVVGLVLMACKRIGRKDTIPLAPFLYAGMLVTIFLV